MPECPEQPVIPNPPPTIGGPFSDCGMGLVGFRSPSPMQLPHGFGDNGLLDGSSTCILPFTAQGWWASNGQPDLPTIRITDNDREIHNSALFPGDVVFYGERVKWISQPGFGAIGGEYSCAEGADNIEVDGECLCPVPEPGLLPALAVGLIGLTIVARFRSWTSGERRGGRCR